MMKKKDKDILYTFIGLCCAWATRLLMGARAGIVVETRGRYEISALRSFFLLLWLPLVIRVRGKELMCTCRFLFSNFHRLSVCLYALYVPYNTGAE